MSMFETLRPLTTRSTIALLPSGERVRARSFPTGAVIELGDDDDTRSMVERGILRPAPAILDVTPAEVTRARTAAVGAAAQLERARARLAEVARTVRDAEMRQPDAPRAQLEKLWNDQRHADLEVRRCSFAVQQAEAALADIAKREQVTEARRELALETQRHAEQGEVIAEICSAVLELKRQVDRAVALGPDVNETRLRVVDAVTRACAAASHRADELSWVLR
jgi:hypothetical protein